MMNNIKHLYKKIEHERSMFVHNISSNSYGEIEQNNKNYKIVLSVY